MIVSVEEIGQLISEPTRPSVETKDEYENIENNPDYVYEKDKFTKSNSRIKLSGKNFGLQIVVGIEFLISQGIDWFARKRLFYSREEFYKAKLLYERYEKFPDTDFNEEEITLLKVYEDYLEIKEKGKLSKAEKRSIEEALEEWIGEIDVRVHPGLFFLFTLLTITSKRIIEVELTRQSKNA